MGFFIGMMFLSIYISQHGYELNFIDVSLLSTLVYMVIGMIIVEWPFRKDRQPFEKIISEKEKTT